MSEFVKVAVDEYYSQKNWTGLLERYVVLLEQMSDPRVKEWQLVSTPLPTLALVAMYLLMATYVLPLFMAKRKPYKLRKSLIVYNGFQVLLSLYMFCEHLRGGWLYEYNYICQPVSYNDDATSMIMLHACWIYYLSKIIEFADTVFFVLRKKQNQITWLHLYHHSATPLISWILIKFVAGGQGTFSNVLNNLVHMAMYSYYLMAALGPEYYRYLWWKKHLTTIQLAQFVIVFFHNFFAILSDCGYPVIISGAMMVNSVIFFSLFMNFYRVSYTSSLLQTKKVD